MRRQHCRRHRASNPHTDGFTAHLVKFACHAERAKPRVEHSRQLKRHAIAAFEENRNRGAAGAQRQPGTFALSQEGSWAVCPCRSKGPISRAEKVNSTPPAVNHSIARRSGTRFSSDDWDVPKGLTRIIRSRNSGNPPITELAR